MVIPVRVICLPRKDILSMGDLDLKCLCPEECLLESTYSCKKHSEYIKTFPGVKNTLY